MSETKWTPGPWSVGKRKKYKAPITADGWAALAKVVVRMKYNENDNIIGVANAHLIAAAPDLYEALEALLGPDRELGGRDSPRIRTARAALAKARGEG